MRTSSTGIHAGLVTRMRRRTRPSTTGISCPRPTGAAPFARARTCTYGPPVTSMSPAFTWRSNAATSSACGRSPAPNTKVRAQPACSTVMRCESETPVAGRNTPWLSSDSQSRRTWRYAGTSDALAPFSSSMTSKARLSSPSGLSGVPGPRTPLSSSTSFGGIVSGRSGW